MEIYLDNSATTPVDPQVRNIMIKTLSEDYGNPSAMYRKGVDAEKYVKEAQSRIARTLKVEEKEIYFTSGGTEANNLAILGTAIAQGRRGKHFITTAVEHPSVENPMKHLQESGYEVTFLPVDYQGRISLEELKKTIRPDTILVSVMMVNNEIGTRQPIEEIGAFLQAEHPEIYFHVDAVQGYGKYVIRPKKWGIDMLSVSGHKIHGPKGIGFLYLRDRVKIAPILFGGGQQKGLRSGTENVPGIAGLGVAAEKIYENHKDKTEYLYSLKERLASGLSSLPDVKIHGQGLREGAPHVLSAAFFGVRSEVLLHALEEREIFVSAGSACSAHHPGHSSTLMAIGLPSALMECTLRFSFSHENTEEEVDRVIEALRELLPFLRKFKRR